MLHLGGPLPHTMLRCRPMDRTSSPAGTGGSPANHHLNPHRRNLQQTAPLAAPRCAVMCCAVLRHSGLRVDMLPGFCREFERNSTPNVILPLILHSCSDSAASPYWLVRRLTSPPSPRSPPLLHQSIVPLHPPPITGAATLCSSSPLATADALLPCAIACSCITCAHQACQDLPAVM
ncbi:hypothetical protein K431DRAFT_163432 [Polychaeton citri CBS 116435]|uniref:Uncharacterized protein n=1 Tax=Polychaeton citri CBS 116435 TaxID=1314669 RepID=A0A9P4UST0_9PEZI|nr:hypothetical protein K431DRAFT_163432 [Polychaeton citri CBS 116435]